MALGNLRASSRGVMAMIILAVVIFFGCVLAYMAAAGKLRAMATELSNKDGQVNNARQIASTLEDSRATYVDTRAQIQYLESSVSTQAYVPTLLKQLEHLGKSVKMKVYSVRPQPVANTPAPVRKMSSGAQASEGNVEGASQQQAGPGGAQENAAAKPYDELKIELELEGSYMSTLEFLYGLTSFPKIVAVDSVDLSPAGATLAFKSPSLTVHMWITAYVLKDEGPVKEPDTSSPAAAAPTTPGERRG